MLLSDTLPKKHFLSTSLFYSYEISGHTLIRRLFGVFPILKVSMSQLGLPRLAAYAEMNLPTALLKKLNLRNKSHSSKNPYLIESQDSYKFIIYLFGGNLFKLRQAIGRAHILDQKKRKFNPRTYEKRPA
jgi:hypothetical protein